MRRWACLAYGFGACGLRAFFSFGAVVLGQGLGFFWVQGCGCPVRGRGPKASETPEWLKKSTILQSVAELGCRAKEFGVRV